jgi:hypothetical protein
MKTLICALTVSALAGIAQTVASAADLGRGYEESETYVEHPAPPPRVVHRYYEPDYYYDDAPVVTYYRTYPYYGGYYPYWGPRYTYWRGGWGHRGWGHAGWRGGGGGWGRGGWGHRGRW